MKKIILFFISFLSLLSCGPIYNPNPTAFELLTMSDTYYYAYIYPNNPDVERESVILHYDMVLLKIPYNGNFVFLVAWEKYENVKNWTLSISNAEYLFSCEIKLLVYEFESKSYLSVIDSVEKGMFSLEILENGFKKLSEYISVTYY